MRYGMSNQFLLSFFLRFQDVIDDASHICSRFPTVLYFWRFRSLLLIYFTVTVYVYIYIYRYSGDSHLQFVRICSMTGGINQQQLLGVTNANVLFWEYVSWTANQLVRGTTQSISPRHLNRSKTGHSPRQPWRNTRKNRNIPNVDRTSNSCDINGKKGTTSKMRQLTNIFFDCSGQLVTCARSLINLNCGPNSVTIHHIHNELEIFCSLLSRIQFSLSGCPRMPADNWYILSRRTLKTNVECLRPHASS